MRNPLQTLLYSEPEVPVLRELFENLTGIRDRMATAKRFHAWAFRRLYEYVEYKGDAEGVAVEQVSPASTSQDVRTAGVRWRKTARRNTCRKCGYELNADYNASKNIARKLATRLRSGQSLRVEEPPINWLSRRGR